MGQPSSQAVSPSVIYAPPEPKGSLGEETIDLKIKSRGVLSGGRQGKVSLSRLSLTISGIMSVFSPRREQPQAGVQGDLGVDSSAAWCGLHWICLGDEGKEGRWREKGNKRRGKKKGWEEDACSYLEDNYIGNYYTCWWGSGAGMTTVIIVQAPGALGRISEQQVGSAAISREEEASTCFPGPTVHHPP